MSDPIEQGEQVEVYLTGEALKERNRLLERVRLLEQDKTRLLYELDMIRAEAERFSAGLEAAREREQGLREALERIRAGNWNVGRQQDVTIREFARLALAASPLTSDG